MTQTRALLLALTAFFVWVIGDTSVKLCAEHALPPFAILAAFGGVGAFCLILLAAVRRDFSILRPGSPVPQGAMALCSSGIIFANVIALKHLPLTMFYTIVFMAPLVIAALSAALKHEVLSRTKIACLLVGFAGTAIAIGARGGAGDWIGCVAATISMSFFASRAILMRTTAKTDTPESTQFISTLSMLAIGVAGLCATSFPPLGLSTAAVLVLAGIANVTGSVLFITAIHHTPTTNVAQFHYTQILFGAIFGYVIWHNVPSSNLILGAGLIIGAGIVVAAEARKKAVKTP
jgi:drug/metabolite transporter (DMT)-like permease